MHGLGSDQANRERGNGAVSVARRANGAIDTPFLPIASSTRVVGVAVRGLANCIGAVLINWGEIKHQRGQTLQPGGFWRAPLRDTYAANEHTQECGNDNIDERLLAKELRLYSSRATA